MNSEPGYTEISITAMAEQQILHTILDGSGGPDEREMTDAGLRFIRYLLSISRCARFGFLPNFKDPDSAREIARQFIRYCGGAAVAMHTMHTIKQGEC
jgi:hypothetical protein